MIRITQIKLKIPHAGDTLKKKVCRILQIRPEEILDLQVIRCSVDARKKPELYYTYTVSVRTKRDGQILKKNRDKNVARDETPVYQFPDPGKEELKHPPVIVGSGPAGLFSAWMLAKHGYRPLVLERGEEASKRKNTVRSFWDGGRLDPESNVQFGEGGAGTFSDGKLNTGVKDPHGRNHLVLELFHRAGAPDSILYEAKPHLGTDLLVSIVEELRRQIIQMGGTFRFRCRVDDLVIEDGRVCGVQISSGEIIPAEAVVLAIGHSARDTYGMLYKRQLSMRMKPIAVGVRVEHPQEMINLRQYGITDPQEIGAADYKLTGHLSDGRGVYSFCMCPGGYVVNASSEEGRLAVNGMSYQARDSRNANSAIVVSVSPDDYLRMKQAGDVWTRDLPEALCGLGFVRSLERNAYLAADGAVPVQRFEDFKTGKSGPAGSVLPCVKGRYAPADVRGIFPPQLAADLEQGILMFDRKIKGFAEADVLLSGVESRTSSPVRIDRDEQFQSNIRGIYPCGEGAGYAGGITSAAMDGIKIAEAIAGFYKNFV